MALYERALALAPRYPDALYNLGVACSEAGQPERALHLYELAVHFQPACAEAWNNLGARPGPSSSALCDDLHLALPAVLAEPAPVVRSLCSAH